MKNQKPKIFTIFKIVGVIGLILLITSFVLLYGGFDDFHSNNFIIGIMLLPISFISTFVGLTNGFIPEITKMRVKTQKYIQQENKEDLTDIATTTADIHSDAVTSMAQAVQKGLNETKFCKYCGAKIDVDSLFCSQCGKQQ